MITTAQMMARLRQKARASADDSIERLFESVREGTPVVTGATRAGWEVKGVGEPLGVPRRLLNVVRAAPFVENRVGMVDLAVIEEKARLR